VGCSCLMPGPDGCTRHLLHRAWDVMRQVLAGTSNFAAALGVALLLAGLMVPLWSYGALSNASGSDASPLAAPPISACGSDELTVDQSKPSASSEPTCGATARTAAEIAQARAYLIETASAGYTMTLQGSEVAIGRLHPEFAARLEHAIRQARSAGLQFAAIFSAYRPPAFGVGGFSDKFNSLHTYGLAVDMRGIGSPGSPEAELWHQIAAKNGVVCPYGPRDPAEWNHCQPTSVKIILTDNPLRQTVSPAGPFDLENMFELGNLLIEDVASAAEYFSPALRLPVTTKASDLISLNVQRAVAQPAPIIAAPAVRFQGWKAQKTVQACQAQWRTLRIANQRTTTEKEYVAECRAGGVAAQLAPTTAAPAVPSQAVAQKTVRVCQEEWRALRITNQRTTTEKINVAQSAIATSPVTASPASPSEPAPLPARHQHSSSSEQTAPVKRLRWTSEPEFRVSYRIIHAPSSVANTIAPTSNLRPLESDLSQGFMADRASNEVETLKSVAAGKDFDPRRMCHDAWLKPSSHRKVVKSEQQLLGWLELFQNLALR
jgi:hypothetical protein